MQVILLQDIKNLGKKYEIKEVKNGFARNFLIPRGLARLATENALEWLEAQKVAEDKEAKEELKKVQEAASAIEGQEVIIPVKLGEEGQLFESITAQKIAENLKKAGLNIEKNQIGLAGPIKELGEFPVKIKFRHNLEAEIKVIVVEKEA